MRFNAWSALTEQKQPKLTVLRTPLALEFRDISVLYKLFMLSKVGDAYRRLTTRATTSIIMIDIIAVRNFSHIIAVKYNSPSQTPPSLVPGGLHSVGATNEKNI